MKGNESNFAFIYLLLLAAVRLCWLCLNQPLARRPPDIARRLRRLFLRQRQWLDRNSRGHRSRACAVALINVRTELNDAVRRRPGGNIDPVEIHWLGELHVLAVARADHSVDLIASP